MNWFAETSWNRVTVLDNEPPDEMMSPCLCVENFSRPVIISLTTLSNLPPYLRLSSLWVSMSYQGHQRAPITLFCWNASPPPSLLHIGHDPPSALWNFFFFSSAKALIRGSLPNSWIHSDSVAVRCQKPWSSAVFGVTPPFFKRGTVQQKRAATKCFPTLRAPGVR